MLFASDLDGTLLRNDETITARTRAAVHAAVGAGGFVYATGRPARWVTPVAELTGHEGVAICSNGAHTIDLRDDSTIDARELTTQQMAAALDAVRAVVTDASFAIQWLSAFGHSPDYVPTFALPRRLTVAPVEALIDRPALKLMFRSAQLTAQLLDEIEQRIGDAASLTYGATPSVHGAGQQLIELMAPGVSKASALELVARRCGAERSDVVSFGDNRNDVEMLQWAGHGVAMANAVPAALAAADEVTTSNDHDGVAAVIERLLA